MTEAAQLQRLDALLGQWLEQPGNTGSGSQNDQNIAQEIEAILASLFSDGGASSTGMPTMPSFPSQSYATGGSGTATQARYTSASNTVPAGNATGECTAASTAQGKQTAQYFMTNLQHDFGLTKNQAAGVVANLWHESGGMNPGINQGGAVGQPNGDMNCGYGIAQWTGSRKEDYLNWCSQNRLNPASEQANYGYLKHELQTTQSGAIAAVKQTQTAQDATVAFCDTFERPGDPEMSSRLAALQYVLSA